MDTFWSCQKVVPRQNGFHGLALPDTRGKTQGGIMSPTLFNVVVDNVIRTWMAMTVEYQWVAQYGLGVNVGLCVGVFRADDGRVGSRNPDWLQHTMNVLVVLFRRYGLATNVANSCIITCHTEALWAGMSEEAMALKCTGGGRLISSETPKADTFPRVCSGTHHGVHNITPLLHAQYRS